MCIQMCVNMYIYIYYIIYMDNPPVQNDRSKSETTKIVRRLPKCSLFPVFFAVAASTFWALNLFCHFIGFFRRFVGFFRRFKTGKHMQHEKNAKSVRRISEAEKNAASNNSWKGNNFAYIGRRSYIYVYVYLCVCVTLTQFNEKKNKSPYEEISKWAFL